MTMKRSTWADDPCLEPPFSVLDYGESAEIAEML